VGGTGSEAPVPGPRITAMAAALSEEEVNRLYFGQRLARAGGLPCNAGTVKILAQACGACYRDSTLEGFQGSSPGPG
jgi:hypothetical protein